MCHICDRKSTHLGLKFNMIQLTESVTLAGEFQVVTVPDIFLVSLQ